MSANALDPQQVSEKVDAHNQLTATNGNAEQKADPATDTSFSDDVEPAPIVPPPSGPGDSDFPEGGARAWGVVAGTTGVIFCSLGYCNAFGIFQNYYLANQLSNKTPSQISWIGSLQIFFLLSGNVIGGPLFDRFGGKIVWPPAVAFVFSVMMTSLCKEYYQFILCQGILGGVSMGMMMAPGMASVGQYFRRKRGQAMGIAVAGSSLGGVLFPIALTKMLYSPKLGFGWTTRIIGFWILAILAVSCPLIKARLPPRKNQFFMPSAFMELPFDLICFATFLMLFGAFTPIFFLPEYAVEHGMRTELASYLLAILNASSLFGRLIPGYLADKFGRFNMYCTAGVSSGILAICWQKITTNAGILVFGAIYGFFSGAIVSLQTTCMATVPKDPRNIGTYLGMGMFVTSFATLAGPPANGALVSKYHSFDQAATMGGVFVLAGGFMVVVVKYVNGREEPGKRMGVFSKT
ncbi:related to monocarboxylate transporter [Phialocephala subalpina]|uniref:Related to monocarboxylate transporter n=1 Tax=Phialocephala subalpina TaxID=576137 RepID=A0A1L7XU78_9HELO|nr:related to monocarboxylate transporter [Phialocephala subalpina]